MSESFAIRYSGVRGLAEDNLLVGGSGGAAVEKTPAEVLTLIDGVSATDAAPRIILGDRIYAIKNEELQLFHRGFVEAIDPYRFYIKFTGVADAYQAYQRYFKVLSTSTTTHNSFAVSVLDDKENVLATQTTVVQIVDTVAQPVSTTRILCIGDSLTANNSAAWVTEFNRRLTGSGGTPTGLGYGNISFIGTQGTGANKHEGHSGTTWLWHQDPATSPFANGGALDFSNYVTVNGFGGIEQVYILLGWNTIENGGPLAADWATDVGYAQTLINAIHSAYPSAKVTILSLQAPGREGRIANRTYSHALRAAFGYKLAIKSIADNPTYSSYVDWIDLASQFDSENNHPTTSKAVNTRNTATETVVTDAIHPTNFGYYQIADAAFRHFIAKKCQGV